METEIAEIIEAHLYRMSAAKIFDVLPSSYLHKGFKEAARKAAAEIATYAAHPDKMENL